MSSIYLLRCNELEQDGSRSTTIRDAYVSYEDAVKEMDERRRWYKRRLDRMNPEQRHRHCMEEWVVEAVALTSPSPTTSTEQKAP